MSISRKIIVFYVLAALLSGCVDSPDYVSLWSKDFVQDELIGNWYGEDTLQMHDVAINIVSGVYSVSVTTTNKKMGNAYCYSFSAKSVNVGDQTFLLCKDLVPSLMKGLLGDSFPEQDWFQGSTASLLRYSKAEDGFTFHHMNCPEIQKLIDEGIIEGTKTKTTPPVPNERRPMILPQVSHFNQKTLSGLAKVFSQSKTWHSPIKFTKRPSEQVDGANSGSAAAPPE